MKKLGSLICLLYILLTIVLGIVLIISISGWFGVGVKVQLIINNQLNSPQGLWTGILLVIIGLLFLKMSFIPRKTNRSISYENPEGDVTVSVKAIEDFVKKVGNEFPQVIEVAPVIIPDRAGVKVRAKTVLIACENVPQIVESLQQAIKSKMQNILGIENVVSVEVHISKLLTKEAKQEQNLQ